MEAENAVDFKQIEFGSESFEDLMGQLFNIKGYKGSAIMTIEGELLFSNFSSNADKKLVTWPAILDSLFAQTCHLSETLGFLGCDQIAIRTSDEILVVRNSAKDCLVGVRLIVMFDLHSNEAMINLKLTKLLPQLMHCLTWDPDNMIRLFPQDSSAGIVGSH